MAALAIALAIQQAQDGGVPGVLDVLAEFGAALAAGVGVAAFAAAGTAGSIGARGIPYHGGGRILIQWLRATEIAHKSVTDRQIAYNVAVTLSAKHIPSVSVYQWTWQDISL